MMQQSGQAAIKTIASETASFSNPEMLEGGRFSFGAGGICRYSARYGLITSAVVQVSRTPA